MRSFTCRRVGSSCSSRTSGACAAGGTFAHYLHIRDTLQTAGAFGIEVHGPAFDADPAEVDGDQDIATILAEWLPLTYPLNAVERSMGKHDPYPFVLAPEVVGKIGFVHEMAGKPAVRRRM